MAKMSHCKIARDGRFSVTATRAQNWTEQSHLDGPYSYYSSPYSVFIELLQLDAIFGTTQATFEAIATTFIENIDCRSCSCGYVELLCGIYTV
jgi:hypothetical protein